MNTYRQRQPRKSPVYRIFNKGYADFKAVYDQKYQRKYGFFRPVIDKEVEKYLKCGIFEYGFARVQCENKDCKEEYLLPFSCKGRSICGSCATKHMLLFQMRITDTVAERVPHRHMVFCMPKALRGGFIRNRPALNVLSRLTFESIRSAVHGIPCDMLLKKNIAAASCGKVFLFCLTKSSIRRH